MSLSSVYVSPELTAFAKRADVSAVHLAAALRDADFKHLDAPEILKLAASCTAPTPRKPDPVTIRTLRALSQV